MIDIVIPYRCTDEAAVELRYALRSFEKHLTEFGNVFIVGDKPPYWLLGAIHIPWPPGNGMSGKEKNIYQKLLAACASPGVSDQFLYANDDHFLLRPYNAATFPYYWHSSLFQNLATNTTPYKATLRNTVEMLGRQALNFDGHCPMVVDKQLFEKTFRDVNWNKPYGYCLKTMYCYANGIAGEFSLDLKLRRPGAYTGLPEGLPYFSTDDKAMDKQTVALLETLYPNKSKYEQ